MPYTEKSYSLTISEMFSSDRGKQCHVASISGGGRRRAGLSTESQTAGELVSFLAFRPVDVFFFSFKKIKF